MAVAQPAIDPQPVLIAPQPFVAQALQACVIQPRLHIDNPVTVQFEPSQLAQPRPAAAKATASSPQNPAHAGQIQLHPNAQLGSGHLAQPRPAFATQPRSDAHRIPWLVSITEHHPAAAQSTAPKPRPDPIPYPQFVRIAEPCQDVAQPIATPPRLDALAQPKMKKIIHDKTYVSPAFNQVLQIPKKHEKVIKRGPKKLAIPKAISGAKALEILRKREDKKEEAIALKEQRKEERERKKIVKEEAKENRLKDKENKKQVNRKMSNSKIKRKISSSDSDSSESVKYVESDGSDYLDVLLDRGAIKQDKCANCDLGDIQKACHEWVGCETCSRWFHRACTRDEFFIYIDPEDIEFFPFNCYMCSP